MKLLPRTVLPLLIVAVPAFFFGPVLFPRAENSLLPGGYESVLQLLLALVASLSLGMGVVCLVRTLSSQKRVALLAVSWLLCMPWLRLYPGEAYGGMTGVAVRLSMDGLTVVAVFILLQTVQQSHRA